MTYLLDTDTVSAVLKRTPSMPVMRHLAGLDESEVFTSAITVGELVFGAVAAGLDDLEKRIELMLSSVPVVSFDEAAGYTYGRVRADLRSRGLTLDDPDLRIAAIAVTHEMTVVTGNQRHFHKVAGLKLENWLT